MSRKAINTALTDPLLGLSLPKAWPNQHFDPASITGADKTYLSITILRSDTNDQTLGGEAPVQAGRLIVTVVVETGKSDGAADDLADTVAALYPMGLRLTAGDQTITITQPPHIREGIPDGGYWRVTVTVPFRAT